MESTKLKEFLFSDVDGKRDKAEVLHDILVSAKVGIGKTRLMYAANLSWVLMNKTLKAAKAAGLIEDVEVKRQSRRGNPLPGLRTTAKGLEYIESVRSNFGLFQEEEG